MVGHDLKKLALYLDTLDFTRFCRDMYGIATATASADVLNKLILEFTLLQRRPFSYMRSLDRLNTCKFAEIINNYRG